MKRLLDYDAETGVREIYHKTDKGFAIQMTQDVAPILEQNKRIRTGQPNNWKGDMHHIASIPLVVAQMWRDELGGQDPFSKEMRPWLIKRLSDPNWASLRTKEGNL